MTKNTLPPHIQQALTELDHPLADFAVIYEQTVEWGDMDAFAHVNNVTYYDYAQRARIHALRQLGMFTAQTYTVVATSSCQYLRPVTYPDTLWLGVRAKKIGNTSLVQEYVYFSTAQNAIVAMGEAVLVFFEEDGVTKHTLTDTEREKLTGQQP